MEINAINAKLMEIMQNYGNDNEKLMEIMQN